MSDTPPPLSMIANELREIIHRKSATDFSVNYHDPTLYGDIQYIRTKTRSAWEKKTQENYKKNDHQVDAKKEIIRPDLVEGELQYALDRCEEALEKLDSIGSDQYRIRPMLERHKDIIRNHRNAAERGEIIYN